MVEQVPTRRVVIIDDHEMLAEMMRAHLIDRGWDARTLGIDVPHLVDEVQRVQPDLVLLDAVFGDDEDGGMRLLAALQLQPWSVAMLTGVTDLARHAQFLDAGAAAVIHKGASIDEVIRQVECLSDGIDPMGRRRRDELAHHLAAVRLANGSGPLEDLSERETTTLQALVDGLTVDEIAQQRTVAVSTVRSQVKAILRKLGVGGQVQAVAVAARQGMRPGERQARTG